jgi:CheY-like chemotaxis protein
MALNGFCILVLEEDAPTATRVVSDLEKARADVVTAWNATEALHRLAHFSFAGASLDYRQGANDRHRVVLHLKEKGIPFLVRTQHQPPADWNAMVVARPGDVVGALARLLGTA